MNLWLRLFWIYLTTLFRPRIDAPFGASIVPLIVLPNDLDINLHMNNARYLAVMDLGRFDLFARSGLLRAIAGARWRPVLSAAQIRFRKELRLWRRFRVETRLVYWEDTVFVMEHRIVAIDNQGADVEAARALARGGVHDSVARRFVPVAELYARMNIVDVASPPASDDVRAFLAEAAFKRAV